MPRRIIPAAIFAAVLLAVVAAFPPRTGTVKEELHRSALAAGALARLATQGDSADRAKLLGLTARLGWRNEAAQQELLRFAFEQRDPEGIVAHATALMSTDWNRADLKAMLVEAQDIPGVPDALAKAIAKAPAWGEVLLRDRGADFNDATLAAVIGERAKADREWNRKIAARLAWRLLEKDRIAAARSIACAVPGFACGERLADWSMGDRFAAGSAFTWRIGNDYARDDLGSLAPAAFPVEQPISIVLALPPGDYDLSFDGSTDGWAWGFACGTRPPRAEIAMDNHELIAVPADCAVQALALKPLRANAAALSLPRLGKRA